MAKTRSSAEVWLPGKGTDQLSGSHLPTNGDTASLRLLMFLHNERKLTLKEVASWSLSSVIQLWQRATIPPQRIDSGMKLYELTKNRKRSNEQYKKNQEEFTSISCQHHLLDIATSDALTTTKVE